MGLMTPLCEFVGGKTAETLNARLISVEITDAEGTKTDTLRVDINGIGLADWPDTGKKISVRLGYKETGLRNMGSFVLSRISESLPQQTLSLDFTAAPFHTANESEFKARRSATYEAKTVGDIVGAIAQKHGFSPRVHSDLRAIVIDRINQDNETDMQFLQRLAKRYDAICKPTDQYLVFGRRGEIKSLSGRALEPVTVAYKGALSPSEPGFSQAVITSADKQKYSGAKARWRNAGAANDVSVVVGDEPHRVLPTVYRTEAEAMQQAEAALRKAKRHGDSLSLDCPGDPRIAAEGLLTLAGFPSSRANVTWSCDRVTHSFRKSDGYRTRLEATLPGEPKESESSETQES